MLLRAMWCVFWQQGLPREVLEEGGVLVQRCGHRQPRKRRLPPRQNMTFLPQLAK